jgi:hypothetical protein
MRYQLPQFIEMEDKLIGPLTLRQFLYLIAVPIICYLLHFFVRLPYVIMVGVIFFPIALLLAFYRINGRPFTHAFLGLLRFVKKPQMYVWERSMHRVSQEEGVEKTTDDEKQKNSVENKKKKKDFKKLAQALDQGNT